MVHIGVTRLRQHRLALATPWRPLYVPDDAYPSTNEFCASDAINTIQSTTSADVTFDTVTSLLGGNGDAASRLQQAFGTGELCTGCVAG